MLLGIIPMAAAADADVALGKTKLGDAVLEKETPSSFTYLRNVDGDAATKAIGETGFWKRLPRNTLVGYGTVTPVNYAVPRTGSVTVSNEGVIGDFSFSLEKWAGNQYYPVPPCLQFNYTALAEGTTNVTVTYFYNYGLVNVSGGCTWYKETATFTVTVTGDSGEDEKPDVTVTYTDGVENEEVFTNQVYTVKKGDPTPAFKGTPTRAGYKFLGWNPEVEETVTGDAVYTAQWELETYTITYDYRGVVKQADVRDAGNPVNFTIKDLPIKLNPAKFKNNEWPQKFLNWRDADGNVVTEITEPGDITLYAYYQFPDRYRVYDEDGKEVEALTVIDWYKEDDFATYEVRPATVDMPGYELDGWYEKLGDVGNVNKRLGALKQAKKYELVGKLSCCINVTVEHNGEIVKTEKFKGLKGESPDYDSLYADIMSQVADGTLSLRSLNTFVDGQGTDEDPIFGTNAEVKILIKTKSK